LGRPDQSAKLWEPLRAHKQRGEAEDEAIDGSEIGRPFSAGTCKTARRVRVASHCEFAYAQSIVFLKSSDVEHAPVREPTVVRNGQQVIAGRPIETDECSK